MLFFHRYIDFLKSYPQFLLYKIRTLCEHLIARIIYLIIMAQQCSATCSFLPFLPSSPSHAPSRAFVPLFESRPACGMPSPADDFVEQKLDLNELLITNTAATFFVRVEGDSMKNAGIFSGDLLIIDRSVQPFHNSIVLAVVDGEFTVKRFCKDGERVALLPENSSCQPIIVTEDMDFSVWGVVTNVIHKVM